MTDAAEKKRYTLYSKADGRPDSEKPCAFFASAVGCKNGANCKFMHGAPPATSAPAKKEVPAPVAKEEPKREKKEKKEKKTQPTPTPAPVAPVAQKTAPTPVVQKVTPAAVPVATAQDKLVLELQQQLLAQQKMMEAQMKMLQQQQLQQQQLLQQPTAVAAPAPVPVKTEQPKKENKRKQEAVAVPNKSPKTVMPPAPPAAVANGFGNLVQTITQRAQVVQTLPTPTAPSARATATYVNNTQDNESGDDDNEFLFGAVNHVLNTGLATSNTSTPYKTDPVPLSASSPFVASDEAVKALHTSGSKHALHGSAKKNIFATKAPAVGKAPTTTTAVPPQMTAPAPVRAAVAPFDPTEVDFASLNWAQLVAATQANNRFNANYSFQEDSSWVKAKPYGAWCAQSGLPTVLSMDCEMCETTDPVTGDKCDNALVRFSVVDCSENGKVLIDALVSPGLPISDARTHIHGITEAELAGATWTLRHAQAALFKLCSDRTVLVGHSLHKDLRALKFSHRNVVDTAYLFTLDGEPGAAPSLRDVSEQVLGTKLSDTHDSVEDARASLYAAAVLLARGPQAPIVRRVGNVSTYAQQGQNGASGAQANAACSLLVHRIPDYCTEQHVQEMIVAYTQVMPAKISPIIRGAPSGGADGVPSGKTSIFFASQLHCDLAFESIPGPNRPDKQGRSQKRVYFKGGGYICVRK